MKSYEKALEDLKIKYEAQGTSLKRQLNGLPLLLRERPIRNIWRA